MRINMEYMKEEIVREVKISDDYKEIFKIFVTCLRSEGITYQAFRTCQIKKNSRQIELPFIEKNQLK